MLSVHEMKKYIIVALISTYCVYCSKENPEYSKEITKDKNIKRL
jgi:hypothetical protein